VPWSIAVWTELSLPVGYQRVAGQRFDIAPDLLVLHWKMTRLPFSSSPKENAHLLVLLAVRADLDLLRLRRPCHTHKHHIVLHSILVVLREEWQHRQYVLRHLQVLEERRS